MDLTTPAGGDWLAIGVGFLVYFIVSFVWWGPVFGGKWAREMGFDMNEGGNMVKPMILQVIASFLVVYVVHSTMVAYTVTHMTGGEGLERGALSVGVSLFGAFMTWVGFFLSANLGRVAWEKHSWTLFGINAGGSLVALLALGLVFGLL